MDLTEPGTGHKYVTTTLTGNARALLGNQYGDTVNIQHATFLLSSTAISHHDAGEGKVVRQNRILSGHTLETITSFRDGGNWTDRGTSHTRELRWDRREDLGVGVFGEVHREECRDASKHRSRAVKVLRRKQLERMRIDYKKELDALIQLSHPDYVHRYVEFYSWYENEDNIYLAREYIHHGDLEKYIQSGLTEADAKQIAYQVLDGICVMHRLDFIHRDIKPANVFVVQHKPVWWVKIGDFSIAKSTITRHTSLHTQVGTQGYQAPEILGLVHGEKPGQYTAKCDVWSFGCLMYEMLTTRLPFPDIGALTRFCNDESTFPRLPLRNSGASWITGEFTWTMLQAAPNDRPSAEQAAFVLTCRCDPPSAQMSPFDTGDHIFFEDCVGRHFKVPRIDCATFEHMQSIIWQAVSYIEHVRPMLKSRAYQLLDASSRPILPDQWASVVQAGSRVTMKLVEQTSVAGSGEQNNLVDTNQDSTASQASVTGGSRTPQVPKNLSARAGSSDGDASLKADSSPKVAAVVTPLTASRTHGQEAKTVTDEFTGREEPQTVQKKDPSHSPGRGPMYPLDEASNVQDSLQMNRGAPPVMPELQSKNKLQLVRYINLQQLWLDGEFRRAGTNQKDPCITKDQESPEIYDLTYQDDLLPKVALLTGGDMLDLEEMRRKRIEDDDGRHSTPGKERPPFRCQNGQYTYDRYGAVDRPIYNIESGGYKLNLDTFTFDLLEMLAEFIDQRLTATSPPSFAAAAYPTPPRWITFRGQPLPEAGTIYLIDCTGRVRNVPWTAGDSWKNVFDFLDQQINDHVLSPWIRKGFFDIVDDRTGDVVLPPCWSASVTPRRPLRMRMWHDRDSMLFPDRKPTDPARVVVDRYIGALDLWQPSTRVPSPEGILKNARKSKTFSLIDFLGRPHRLRWSKRGKWKDLQNFISEMHHSLDQIIGARNTGGHHYDLYCFEQVGILTQETAENCVCPDDHIYMLPWPRCSPVSRTLYRRVANRLARLLSITPRVRGSNDDSVHTIAASGKTAATAAMIFSDPMKLFEEFARAAGDQQLLDVLPETRLPKREQNYQAVAVDGKAGLAKSVEMHSIQRTESSKVPTAGGFSFHDPDDVFAQFANSSGDDALLSLLPEGTATRLHLPDSTHKVRESTAQRQNTYRDDSILGPGSGEDPVHRFPSAEDVVDQSQPKYRKDKSRYRKGLYAPDSGDASITATLVEEDGLPYQRFQNSPRPRSRISASEAQRTTSDTESADDTSNPETGLRGAQHQRRSQSKRSHKRTTGRRDDSTAWTPNGDDQRDLTWGIDTVPDSTKAKKPRYGVEDGLDESSSPKEKRSSLFTGLAALAALSLTRRQSKLRREAYYSDRD